jgi:hypothetical protein
MTPGTGLTMEELLASKRAHQDKNGMGGEAAAKWMEHLNELAAKRGCKLVLHPDVVGRTGHAVLLVVKRKEQP